MKSRPKILVLGIGNELLCDDAAGLTAARELKKIIPAADVEVIETNSLGLDLLETMEGYDYALLLDAVMTGKHKAGTVLEFSPHDFSVETSSSPHYTGLPDVFALAEKLKIKFPKEVRILAVEAEDPFLLHEGLTVAVNASLPELVKRGAEIIRDWNFVLSGV